MFNKQLRKLKFLLIQLLRIEDKAHSIALGFTIGLLINFIPSFGVGPLISTACAKLFKGNPFAGFIGGISIIWLFPFLFYLNIVVGEMYFPIEISYLEEVVEDTSEVVEVGLQVGKAFFMGMVTNLILFGFFIYFVSFTILKKYRQRLLKLILTKWTL